MSQPAKNGATAAFTVSYPPYRTDIRHMVDLFEDVAIGYGYAQHRAAAGAVDDRRHAAARGNAQRPRAADAHRPGLQRDHEPAAHDRRASVRAAAAADARRATRKSPIPKLKAYNVVRTHLMGGLFEALRENRRRPMPQRLFEIDNVVELDDDGRDGRGRIAPGGARRNRPRKRLRHGPQRDRRTAARAGLESRVRARSITPRSSPAAPPTVYRRRQADRRSRRSPPRSAHELRPHVSRRPGRTDAAARVLKRSRAIAGLPSSAASAIMAGMLADTLQTIPAFLADTVARRGDEPALGFIRDGELHWRTWREVADDALATSGRDSSCRR